MTHTEMDELYELYAMGVLEREVAAVIDSHLAAKCEHCELRVRQARILSASLVKLAPLHQPPAALRERVLQSVTREKPEPEVLSDCPRRSSGSIFGWIAALAALLIACVFLGVRSQRLGKEVQSIGAQLASANRDRAALEAALKDLSRSEIHIVQFGGANQPHGRVFVNRNRGVVFVASSLPRLQSGRTFQLWLVPNRGTPRSAGVFEADDQGFSVRVSHQPVDNQTKAVAVSIEPEGGSPAPTTTPIIIVPVGA